MADFCWSYALLELLCLRSTVDKNTRDWFTKRQGNMEWDYTQWRSGISSIALSLTIIVSKASEQKKPQAKKTVR